MKKAYFCPGVIHHVVGKNKNTTQPFRGRMSNAPGVIRELPEQKLQVGHTKKEMKQDNENFPKAFVL